MYKKPHKTNQWIYKGSPMSRDMFSGMQGILYLFIFPNGRYYIGKTSFKEKLETYFGSNEQVDNYIKKHGVEEIKRVMLMVFETQDEAFHAEDALIKKVGAVENNRYMNMNEGGKGFSSGENHPMFGLKGENHPRYNKKHSELSKIKMSNANKGEKNAMYGRVGEESVMFGVRGKDHPRSKHYGKTLFVITNEFSCKKVYKGKKTILYSIFEDIQNNNGLEYGKVIDKYIKIMRHKDLMTAIKMLVDRKQVELR